MSLDKTYLLQEWITPLERRLYFTTAHTHFLAGCPALALEVLSKLPDHVQQPECDASTNIAEPIVKGKSNQGFPVKLRCKVLKRTLPCPFR